MLFRSEGMTAEVDPAITVVEEVIEIEALEEMIEEIEGIENHAKASN